MCVSGYRISYVWKGDEAGWYAKPEMLYWCPQVAQAPTYPLQGLLGSTGSWLEKAEKPVPKQHPRCPDSLLPLGVDQEHSKALDKRVRRGPLR